MNHQNALKVSKEEPSLTVSYKATPSLDGFLHNLPDVVIITDANFTIRGFNKAAELFFRQPALHFIGKKMAETIPMVFRQTTLELALQELFASGIWNGEIIFESSRNQQYAFRSTFSLLYDESGLVNSIVLVNHNIAEEERQQKHLLLVENKYRTVVETLSEGVMLINADGTIGASNRKAAEILGIEESELKGRSINTSTWNAIKDDGTIFPVEEFPALVTLRTGVEKNDVVMGLQQPGGKRKWLSINSRPIFNENSTKPDAVVASFKDISVEKFKT